MSASLQVLLLFFFLFSCAANVHGGQEEPDQGIGLQERNRRINEQIQAGLQPDGLKQFLEDLQRYVNINGRPRYGKRTLYTSWY